MAVSDLNSRRIQSVGNSRRQIELRGRRLVVFPDSGCLGKWSQRLRQAQGISYTLSEQLEQYPPNTDLADLLLNDIA